MTLTFADSFLAWSNSFFLIFRNPAWIELVDSQLLAARRMKF
jgi:hypothetical protein